MPTINGKAGHGKEVAVTDAAEVNIIAVSFCAAIYVAEKPSASGWPRSFLVRLPMPGSDQLVQAPGTSFRFPGPFAPGDIAGTVELVSNGGDSSTLNKQELSQ